MVPFLHNGSGHWSMEVNPKDTPLHWTWLQNLHSSTPVALSVDRLVKLGLHNDDDIRTWGLSLLQDRDIPGNELIALMPLLETGGFDVQKQIAERLRSTADLPLSLLLRLVDSTKSAQSPTAISVTELGKELLESHYGVDLNQDLVLQLSEHPTDDAEDYVASKLSEDQSADRLLALTPYFKRVLTRLNSGRTTRDSILTYLRKSGSYRAKPSRKCTGFARMDVSRTRCCRSTLLIGNTRLGSGTIPNPSNQH